MLPLSIGPALFRYPLYCAVQAARSLAAGTVATGAVSVGFLVTTAIAVLAMGRGTRAYRRAMALRRGTRELYRLFLLS